LILALLGSGLLFLCCLSCSGIGVGFLLFESAREEQPTAFVPRIEPNPEPVGRIAPNPRPGAVEPPLNLLPQKPSEFPPALASPQAEERIQNGDFEQGLKGFRSAYRHLPEGLREENTFALVRNPNQVHFQAASFGDHTSGTGLLMAVNGGNEPNRLLWGQTVAVRPGTEYTFSLWLTSWFSLAPAELEVHINGKPLQKFLAPLQCGDWKECKARWSAGADKEAMIEIFNLTCAHAGNDFALDDISLRGPPPDPPDRM
jgi:hypothetical protein